MNKEKDWLDEVIDEHLYKTNEIPPLPQPFTTQDERDRWDAFVILQKEHIDNVEPTTIYNWRDKDNDNIF